MISQYHLIFSPKEGETPAPDTTQSSDGDNTVTSSDTVTTDSAQKPANQSKPECDQSKSAEATDGTELDESQTESNGKE